MILTMESKVQTRDGRPARIICVDANTEYPVIALVGKGKHQATFSYTPEGRFIQNGVDKCDLVPIPPEKETGWVIITPSKVGYPKAFSLVFKSRKGAENSAKKGNKIIPIEWEV